MQDEENDIELDREDLDDSVVEEEYSHERVKKLRVDLKDAQDKAREYLDGWQRDKADFVNLRKRDDEAKMQFLKFATESLIVELIPVLDSFDLALAHGATDIAPVHKQLLSLLKLHSLEVSEPVGEVFNPRLHESVGITETDKSDEDQKILEVIQKGYILSKKIIRPAKVKIGEYKHHE